MEVIALILVIVLALLSSKGKARQNGRAVGQKPGAAPKAGQPAAMPANRANARDRRAARQAPVVAQPTVRTPEAEAEAAVAKAERLLNQVQEQLNARMATGEGASMLDDEECHGGSMAHTHDEGNSRLKDEECYGGSMAHSHAEGVDRREQARRMAELDRRQSRERLAPAATAIDAAQLRRAVVMSEVLGRPKALRKARI